jgi:hypothetical protein
MKIVEHRLYEFSPASLRVQVFVPENQDSFFRPLCSRPKCAGVSEVY